jgi:hypothetical protein
MHVVLRYLLFAALTITFSNVSVSAQPSRAGAADDELAGRHSSALDARPAPSSVLLVGGGLLVLGSILRRRANGVARMN